MHLEVDHFHQPGGFLSPAFVTLDAQGTITAVEPRRPVDWPATAQRVAGGVLAIAAVARPNHEANAGASVAVFEYSLELAVPGPNGWEFGEIHLYAVDDGGDMAARQADGRAAMLARFPGAVELDEDSASAAFRLFAAPVRWPQAGASWLYNPSGSTSAMPEKAAFEAITAGAQGWDNAGSSGFHFDYLGETATATGCNGNVSQYAKDGKNVVGWGHIVGGHLGYSCHWRSASLVPATPYFAIEEIDIVFEPLFAYSADSLHALALHEFGHALGLDHTEAPACPVASIRSPVPATWFPPTAPRSASSAPRSSRTRSPPIPTRPTPRASSSSPGSRPATT